MLKIITNIGAIERIVRVILGILIAAVAVWQNKKLWAFLGIFPALTGIFGWCPLYHIFGINTETEADKKLVSKVRQMAKLN